MSAKQILVLGGGFAGLWSAVGAARKLDELGHGPEAVEVTLVNRDAFHSIRVRNYEADLTCGPGSPRRRARPRRRPARGGGGRRHRPGRANRDGDDRERAKDPSLRSARLRPGQPAPPAERPRPGRAWLRRGHLQRRGPAQHPSPVAARPARICRPVYGHRRGRRPDRHRNGDGDAGEAAGGPGPGQHDPAIPRHPGRP